jgi:Protein of unknown function (DUF4089)
MPAEPKDLEQFMDAAGRVLGLPMEAEWLPAIKAHLQVSLTLAQSVAEFELPDEAEPAPVFEA